MSLSIKSIRSATLVASIFLLALPCASTAQDGVSTASAARSSYLSSLGVIPPSREIAVEDFINYHRHEIGRPKIGEAVRLDVRWTSDVTSEGSVFLQIGLSTALLNDRRDRKPVNLALVIDKSGSMAGADKMSRVKAALQTLVTKLHETDVLSIVVYDTKARVLLPATRMTNKRAVLDAIRGIGPGGSTNLEAGLTLGYEEALKHYKKGATNRVILLTDGIANQGVTDPDEIASGSVAYNRRGIDLTTIGVGRDLNHDLLDELAKSGRGLFHFVADSKDIEKVFDKEVQSLLSPVATEPKIEIHFPTSVLVEKVYGYDAIIHGNKVTVELDNMNNGMTEVVLVKFRPVVERDFAASVMIWLSYYDIERGRKVSGVEHAHVSFPTGGVEDRSVTKNATIAVLAQAIHDMAALHEAGRSHDAWIEINKAISSAHQRYPYMEDPDIKRIVDTAEKYQDALRKNNLEREPYERPTVPVRRTRTAPNPLPNGSFVLGNSGFSSALKYTPPSKNCLWQMGYTIAPTWKVPTCSTR